MKPTDEYELMGLITRLNSHKTPGYLDITTILIKESKFLISNHLARLLNTCLTDGFYPDLLKITKLILLHKNGTKYELGNYRPISILSPVNKIFETIIHRRLIDFWDKYNLFTNCQFGFRKNYSTTLALAYLNELIIEKRDQNYHFCGIFMDFAKAFDCVNHKILLDKLEHYGAMGCAYALIRSYLSNRVQYTVNNEQTSSDMLPITIGEQPQGSVLYRAIFVLSLY